VRDALIRAGVSLRRAWDEAAKKNMGKRYTGHLTQLRHMAHGYVLLYMPEHPRCNKSGRILEHRWIMENTLQRPLRSDEHVHHLNGNRADNTKENLAVMTNGEHAKGHGVLLRNQSVEQKRAAGRIGAHKRWGKR